MADNSSGPGNNIFTVLAFIDFVTLLIGVGYTWMRLQAVTGNINPFA
ncbi:MAG: hypothetical protein AAF911_14270 [Planctomycetota bacterium]